MSDEKRLLGVIGLCRGAGDDQAMNGSRQGHVENADLLVAALGGDAEGLGPAEDGIDGGKAGGV